MNTTFDRRVKTQLKTWFTAVGIQVALDQGLHVKDSEGQDIRIELEGQSSPGLLVVSGPDFTSRDLQHSLDAFQALQERLGFVPKLPVDRGALRTKKAHYASDFELVAMRHSEFRRAPNPAPGKLESYRVAIDKAVWKFYRTNAQRCQDNLLGVDDLRTYAQVWAVNYIALYETEGATKEDNERFLFQYLGQRFTEFRKVLDKKNRNVLPMLDDAFISMHGRTYDYANKAAWITSGDGDEQGMEIAAPEGETDGGEDATRYALKPQAGLDAQLDALDHDKKVEVLRGAVENDRIHPEARREASKRLRAHALNCNQCSKVDFPRAHGDDSIKSDVAVIDEDGTVYASVAEAAKALKVFPSNVRAVLSGRYQSTGGHVFHYASPAGAEAEAVNGVEA